MVGEVSGQRLVQTANVLPPSPSCLGEGLVSECLVLGMSETCDCGGALFYRLMRVEDPQQQRNDFLNVKWICSSR